jgi:membrane protein
LGIIGLNKKRFNRIIKDLGYRFIHFSLLFAILPTTIFLFTLIPFIPIQNFQTELLELFQQILPGNAYNFLETSLIAVITEKSGGLLIIMFFVTLAFSSTGMHRLINVFNISHHPVKTRNWINQRKISLILVFVLTVLLTIAVLIIIFSNTVIGELVDLNIIEKDLVFYIAQTAKWIVIVTLIFFAISFLYYFAPAKRKNWRFFSVGSIVATLLFILSSVGV